MGYRKLGPEGERLALLLMAVIAWMVLIWQWSVYIMSG